MENEGGNIEVRVGKHSSSVGHQYQVIDDVWWPTVMSHNADAGLGGFELHASGNQARSITEPQMSGISADDLVQVSVPRCRLLIEGIIVHNLLVKGEQNSGSVLPPLGQSAMNVVNVRHCPWYCEVHGSGLTHQVL